MATSPEGYYTTNEFWYADNGKAVLKRTWIDPSTGQTWDTFDSKDGQYDLPNGTVFDPDSYQAPVSNEGASASTEPHYGNPVTGASNNQQGQNTMAPPPRPASTGPTGQAPMTDNNSSNPGGNPKPIGNPMTGGGPATAQMGGVPNYGTGGQGNDEFLRNQNLYDYARNPEFAFSNVLSGMGMNPVMPSPFMDALRRQALPMQSAYMLQAGNGYNPGMDPWSGYASFVKNVLQNGSMAGTYGQAANNFGQTANAARDFFTQLNANPSLSNVNPLMADLAYTMMNNSGVGGLGMLSNLMGGALGGRVGQSYGQAVKGAGLGAMRQNWMDAGMDNPNGSIFDYLFQ